MELLREEAARGAAVAVTLHELALATRCDRILVLHHGRIAAEGRPETALTDDILARVFAISVARASGSIVPLKRIPPIP